MKTKNPYFLNILNTPEELNVIGEKLDSLDYSQPENFKILEIAKEVKKQIYHDINDFNTVIFCTPEMVEKIKKVNDFYGYNVEIVPANEMLFHNKLDLSKADSTFNKLVDEWIFDNFDGNDVFDKIGEGIELTEVDRLILNNTKF